MKYIERKIYIENIINILFEVIAEYLQYDDYYIFYEMFASKNNDYFIRKCLYCKKTPICPVNIVLNTNNNDLNKKLWLDGGYTQIPSVEDNILELANSDLTKAILK